MQTHHPNMIWEEKVWQGRHSHRAGSAGPLVAVIACKSFYLSKHSFPHLLNGKYNNLSVLGYRFDIYSRDPKVLCLRQGQRDATASHDSLSQTRMLPPSCCSRPWVGRVTLVHKIHTVHHHIHIHSSLQEGEGEEEGSPLTFNSLLGSCTNHFGSQLLERTELYRHI